MHSPAALTRRTTQHPVPGSLDLLRPALAKLLHDASSAVARDASTVQSCLAQALALLKRDASRGDGEARATGSRCGLAPWQERRVTAYIEGHVDEHIRVADLAALSRLSASYFSVAFKRSFGATVQEFICRLRVEKAKMLMLSTDQSLSQIALACGYCDQAHLCRQFRRMTDNTPRAWRQEHKATASPIPAERSPWRQAHGVLPVLGSVHSAKPIMVSGAI